MYAARKGRAAVVSVLQDHNANIDTVDNDNNKTSVMHADDFNHEKVKNMLLYHRAKLETAEELQQPICIDNLAPIDTDV